MCAKTYISTSIVHYKKAETGVSNKLNAYYFGNRSVFRGALIIIRGPRFSSFNHSSGRTAASKNKLYLPTEEKLRAEIEAQKTIFHPPQEEKQGLPEVCKYLFQ